MTDVVNVEVIVPPRGPVVVDVAITDDPTLEVDTPELPIAVDVTNPTQSVVVDVFAGGVVGPQGPPGTGGTGGSGSYHHVQMTSSTTWVVNHNLGFFPNVTAVDSLGREIVPEVAYTNANVVTLTFSPATSGDAYCS